DSEPATGSSGSRRCRSAHSRSGTAACRPGPRRARRPGGVAYLGRNRPWNRPGRPSPGRGIPCQELCPQQIAGVQVTLRPGFTILSRCPISSALAAWRQRSKEVEERRLNVHVSPVGFPALVLNADFRPLSYYPLSLWSWQDAIKAVFLERVNIVA